MRYSKLIYALFYARYGETLMHLLKGNVGSGIFAMGDAIRNAGILIGPGVVLILGIICVHCQHLLVSINVTTAIYSRRHT
jgi:amino acid permease